MTKARVFVLSCFAADALRRDVIYLLSVLCDLCGSKSTFYETINLKFRTLDFYQSQGGKGAEFNFSSEMIYLSFLTSSSRLVPRLTV
jgi:hypothetical protein